MDATKLPWKKIAFSVTALFSQMAAAMELGRVKFLFNSFQQKGTKGNQVYDDTGKEDVTVFEPMLFVVANVNEDTQINANFTYDSWTAASDTAIDGETGASGGGIEQQARVSGQLGYQKGDELNNWSTRLGISQEYDYNSLNIGGSWVSSYAQDNFTLAISPQIFMDEAKEFDLVAGGATKFKKRSIYALDASASQLLSASDILQFGYTFVMMDGMLNSIASTVKVLDEPTDPFQRQTEQLPSKRTRHALYTKWVHGFSDEVATHLSYRFYQDDWQIQAHTAEAGLRFASSESDWFVMPTLRFHQQSATKYFEKEFASTEKYMTSASDLAQFSSTRVGLHFGQDAIAIKPFGHASELELSLGAYMYQRTNGLTYSIYQVGVGVVF